jgi:hypothetical protein
VAAAVAADRAAGYRCDISILQAEFSLTQMLDAPLSGRVPFEDVIRENLDLGRPDKVGLIFDRQIRRRGNRPTPGRWRTRVLTVTDHGLRLAIYLTRVHRRLLCNGLADLLDDHALPTPARRHLDRFTHAVDHNIRQHRLIA